MGLHLWYNYNYGDRGSGVKKHVDFIWKIPSLWCYCFLRNVKILLRSEVICVSMCWPFDFSIVILGVIFDTFCTSFGYWSFDVGTGTSKFCIEVHSNELFWMKKFDLEIFVSFGWFGPKIAYFYKKCDLRGSLGNLFHLQGMSYNHEIGRWMRGVSENL